MRKFLNRVRLQIIRWLLKKELCWIAVECTRHLQISNNHANSVLEKNPNESLKWNDSAWHAYHHGCAEEQKDLLRKLLGLEVMSFRDVAEFQEASCPKTTS